MGVGNQLRQAREQHGISLTELSDRTKISQPNLRAIERDDFDRVPGGLFTRGFLRAYAHEVGLDPEPLVQQYLEEVEPPPPPDLNEIAEVAEPHGPEISAPEMENLERRLERGQVLGSVVVLLVGALVYFLLARDTQRQEGSAAVAGGPAAASADIQTAGTSGILGDASAAPAAALRPAGVHLELQPQGPCWVAATTDGRQAIQRLMNAGDRETIDATEEAVLRVGDAAACAFSINGSPARPAGIAGKPMTLHITKANYVEFVKPGTQTGAPNLSRPTAQNPPGVRTMPAPADPATAPAPTAPEHAAPAPAPIAEQPGSPPPPQS